MSARKDDDARFEEAATAADRPLRLHAAGPDDLAVISSLLQDAVGRSDGISWLPKRRRLVVLLNRFRWEDAEEARRAGRPFERVRSALVLDSVRAVRARGLDPKARDAVVSVLALAFEEGEDAAGVLRITCAGGTELAVECECIDATLADMTKPWVAQSDALPSHGD